MPSENPYDPPQTFGDDEAPTSLKSAPAPQLSGKVAILVIPLAVLVTGLVVGRTWMAAGVLTLTVSGILWFRLTRTVPVNKEAKPSQDFAADNRHEKRFDFCPTCGVDREIDEDDRCVGCGYTV